MSVKRIEFLMLKLVIFIKIKSSCRIQGKKKIEKKTLRTNGRVSYQSSKTNLIFQL